MSKLKKRKTQQLEEVALENLASENEDTEQLIDSNRQSSPIPSTRDRNRLPRLYALLRSLGLQLLAQLTPWRARTERPKPPMQEDRGIVLLQSLLHLPPSLGAFSLIALNIHGCYVSYSPGTAIALQFVAKLHEIWMHASLGAMLLKLVNEELCFRFIPLGWLFAPTYTSKVSYLWSLEFWSSITSSASFSRGRRIFWAIMTIWFLLFAALLGPSSAILMIPRAVSYWKGSSYNISLDHPLSLEYPSQILEEHLQSDISASFIQSIDSLVATGSESTFEDHGSMWKGELQLDYAFALSYSYGSAHFPALQMTSRLVRYYQVTHFDTAIFNNMIIKARGFRPEVVVRCMPNTWNELPDAASTVQVSIDKDGPYDFMYLYDLVNLLPDTSVDRASHWTHSEEWPDSAIGVFIDVSNPGAKLTLSDTLQNPESLPWNGSQLRILACDVQAFWSRADYHLFPRDGRFQIEAVPLTAAEERPGALETVQVPVASSWCQKVLKQLERFLGDLHKFTELDGSSVKQIQKDENAFVPMRLLLAVSFAQAMAEIAPQLEVSQPNDNNTGGRLCPNEQDVSKGLPCALNFHVNESCCSSISATVEATGYGYMAKETAVWLSLLCFFCYFLLVALFLFNSMLFSRTTTAWDTPVEVVALALQSRCPEHLGNLSSGIETMATLREPVGVRVNENNKLELVFKNDPQQKGRDLKYIERNKAY